MARTTTLLWLRHDLRLADNPALRAAIARGDAVVPVYVWDAAAEGRWKPGAASRWWLHHSLEALANALAERGGRLIVASGDSAEVLRRLARTCAASAVYWNRRYEPAARAQEAHVTRALAGAGVEARGYHGALLHEPTLVLNRQGQPFQVFTPYWRQAQTLAIDPPAGRAPARWPAPSQWPESRALGELRLLPRIGWDAGLRHGWTPGEAAAQRLLRRFLRGPIEDYDRSRDRPDEWGTSRLSPHLHFGEISPHRIWAEVRALGEAEGVFPSSKGARVFLAELGWREFAHDQLYHNPDTAEQPRRPEFATFPWRTDPDGTLLAAWQKGRTGFPIVDAGLRELWATGWMHNRVRMIVASFLVKHLRLPWNDGAAWFWDTLVDADLANNTLGWQWSAGCGADAAPYFRIFNPMLQAAKFDPDGRYVRHWVTELAKLSGKWIHAPWQAPGHELQQAGVLLDDNYPRPIVDHATAREEALKAFRDFRERAAHR